MATLDYYNKNAKVFVAGTISANMEVHYSCFTKYLKSGSKILDLGCGSGRDSFAFQKMGYKVTAIDGSEEVCKEATRQTGIDVKCMTFEELPYQNEFDGVWACASLLHVKKSEMKEILKKVTRTLKCSGVLYCSYKYGNQERIFDGRYFSDYTEKDILDLLADTGLKCEKYWISSDVRTDRENEKWLNIIAVK